MRGAGDYRQRPSPRRMVSFSLCRSLAIFKIRKKIALRRSKTGLTFASQHFIIRLVSREKCAKKVSELITVESKLLLSQSLLIVYLKTQLSDSHF